MRWCPPGCRVEPVGRVVWRGEGRRCGFRSAEPGAELKFGEALADGVFRQFGHVVESEFFHEMEAVGFDGFRAQAEAEGDLLGGLTVGDQAEALAFAVGECGVGGLLGGGEGGAVAVGDGGGDFRAEVGVTGHDGADGLEEFEGGVILDDVTFDAGLQGFLHQFFIGVGREHDESGIGALIAQAMEEFGSAQQGQVEIDDGDIRQQFCRLDEGRLAVPGFADDFEVGMLAEEEPESVANHQVIIDQQYPCFHGTASGNVRSLQERLALGKANPRRFSGPSVGCG